MIRLIASTLAMASPVAAQAECRASIDSSRALPPSADYNPFSPAPTIVPFDLVLQNVGEAACDLRLAMHGRPGPRAMRASGLVTYGIISASGVVLRNDPGGQLGLPVRLQPGERTSVRLAIRVPAGQIVRSGSYKDLVDLDLFDRDGRRMDNTKSLPTELRVAARTQINVSGAASSFGSSAGAGQVHFEQLTPGANRRLFVQLWSNSSAKVSVKSENQGRLVNRALGPQAVIPYSLVIDGERADLVRGSKLRRRPPITLDGASYEVRLQIEPFGASFAGTYRDTITLTVEPEE